MKDLAYAQLPRRLLGSADRSAARVAILLLRGTIRPLSADLRFTAASRNSAQPVRFPLPSFGALYCASAREYRYGAYLRQKLAIAS